MTAKTQSATATAPKKSRSKKEIEKPKKVLNETLQHKKDLLEQLGWKIHQEENKTWTGERLSTDEGHVIREFGTFSLLFDQITIIEEKDFISHLTDDESVAILEWRVKGWKFEQDEDQMWSATKGDEFAGKISDLRPLFSYIEGTETGDHKTAMDKMIADTIAGKKKEFEAEEWRFVEVKDPDGDHWTATNPSPSFPNFTGADLSDVLKRIGKWKSEQSEKFADFSANFGKPKTDGSTKTISSGLSGDYKKRKKQFESEGFHFKEVKATGKDNSYFEVTNKNFSSTNIIGESLEYLIDRIDQIKAESQEKPPAPLSQEELTRRAVKESAYLQLIKEVILGADNWNKVIVEFKIRHGEDWFYEFGHHSDQEIRDEIKNLWLGDLDGDEESLTAEYRSTRIDSVDESRFKDSPVIELSIDEVDISEFAPQWHRRNRFKPEDLQELADSIKKQGLINPITVRRVNVKVIPHDGNGNYNLQFPDKEGGPMTRYCKGMSKEKVEALARKASHEIVAGERRFRATELAGLDKILCFVKDLTDEQALEIQLQENLQRVDVNPLDEAFSYKYLMEKQNMTVQDLMVKFGKTEKYITLRLKLNNLIPEVLDVISSGHLPLGHAVEISKFDEVQQKEALNCCFDTSWQSGKGHVADLNKPLHLKAVVRNIASKVLLKLKDAPFPIKDKRLRADGLICPNCPERTGANNPMSLFEEYQEDGTDRCLNPSCYQAKTSRYIQIKRDDATKKVKKELNCADDYQIRVLAYHSSNKAMLNGIFGGGVLTDGEYKNCYGNPCKSAQPAIFLDPVNYKFGEVIQICLDKNCTKHRSGSSSTATASGEKTDAEKAKFYERKQEIFDVKVGESVRLKTLAEAAKTFNKDRWVFEDEKWRVQLVARLWSKTDDHAHRAVETALGRKEFSISPGWSHSEGVKYFTENFTADDLSKILFLLIIANEGEMLYGNWKDQTPIVEVAVQFGVNYDLLDAQDRAELAPKKFKDAAKEHLGKIERGENIKRPVFYKLEK